MTDSACGIRPGVLVRLRSQQTIEAVKWPSRCVSKDLLIRGLFLSHAGRVLRIDSVERVPVAAVVFMGGLSLTGTTGVFTTDVHLIPRAALEVIDE